MRLLPIYAFFFKIYTNNDSQNIVQKPLNLFLIQLLTWTPLSCPCALSLSLSLSIYIFISLLFLSHHTLNKLKWLSFFAYYSFSSPLQLLAIDVCIKQRSLTSPRLLNSHVSVDFFYFYFSLCLIKTPFKKTRIGINPDEVSLNFLMGSIFF